MSLLRAINHITKAKRLQVILLYFLLHFSSSRHKKSLRLSVRFCGYGDRLLIVCYRSDLNGQVEINESKHYVLGDCS